MYVDVGTVPIRYDTILMFYHTQWTAEGSVFGAASLVFFVYEISREPLNEFAPNSHGRRARKTCLVPRSDEFEGQRSRSPGTKAAFFGPFCGLRAVYVSKDIKKVCLVAVIFKIHYASVE